MAAEAFWESPQASAAFEKWKAGQGNNAHFLRILIDYLDNYEQITVQLDEHQLDVDEVREIRKRVLEASEGERRSVQRAEVRKLAIRSLGREQISDILDMALAEVDEALPRSVPPWGQAVLALWRAGERNVSAIERQVRLEFPSCRRQNIYRLLREAGLLPPASKKA